MSRGPADHSRYHPATIVADWAPSRLYPTVLSVPRPGSGLLPWFGCRPRSPQQICAIKHRDTGVSQAYPRIPSVRPRIHSWLDVQEHLGLTLQCLFSMFQFPISLVFIFSGCISLTPHHVSVWSSVRSSVPTVCRLRCSFSMRPVVPRIELRPFIFEVLADIPHFFLGSRRMLT